MANVTTVGAESRTMGFPAPAHPARCPRVSHRHLNPPLPLPILSHWPLSPNFGYGNPGNNSLHFSMSHDHVGGRQVYI